LRGKKVKVGAFTYGIEDIEILSWGENIEISFGRFCSIASGLKLYCGGNHRSDWISTFPFGHVYSQFFKLKPISDTPVSNGDITIGNDVWIGRDVTILSGISIGDGAIIASNSHVVKNVLPYTIVGGNPAKVIKSRFNDDVIKMLLDIQWWNLHICEIEKIITFLCFQESNNLEINLQSIKDILASNKTS
jgi:acetyltransferase-like isoleucine patch superfamily enzyme